MKNGIKISFALSALLVCGSAFAAAEPVGSQGAGVRINFVPEAINDYQSWAASISDAFTLDFTQCVGDQQVGQIMGQWSFNLFPVAQGDIANTSCKGVARVGNTIFALLTQPFTENNQTNDLIILVKLNPATGVFTFFRRGLNGRIQGDIIVRAMAGNSLLVTYNVITSDGTTNNESVMLDQDLQVAKRQNNGVENLDVRPMSSKVTDNYLREWQLFQLKGKDLLAFGNIATNGSVTYFTAPLNQIAKGADRNLTVRAFVPLSNGLLAVITQPNPTNMNEDVMILVRLNFANNDIQFLRSIVKGNVKGGITIQEHADGSLNIIYVVNSRELWSGSVVNDNISSAFQYID